MLFWQGANVLHPDAVAPARASGVVLNIKNTSNPQHPGTLVVPDGDVRAARTVATEQVIGVTGIGEAGVGEPGGVVIVCTTTESARNIVGLVSVALAEAGIANKKVAWDTGVPVVRVHVAEEARPSATRVIYKAIGDSALFVAQQD